jgi:TolB-like protein/DNA-binding winged helix-turn-helix (wHTH) protein/Flp pilus assembly protein TadD
MPSALPERVRFGVFEADLRSRELFKQGRKVRLHQQAFQTLALLLEHPGELVTRDELQRRLWSSDTFVNFDLGLNSAVKKVRDALHDSADSPQYVETLPRRGYRFIAPVEIETVSIPTREEAALSEAKMEEDSPSAVERPAQQTIRWTQRRPVRWGVAVAASLLFALALQDFVWRRHPLASAVPPVRGIAVLPLENLSGDPGQEYFVDGMTEALITNLMQISALKVISRTSVMGYKATRKSLEEIARELSVDAVVEGAVIRKGERVRIDARLVDVATERHLWAATYERNVVEVTSLQNDIARTIADEIRVTLTPQEQARLRRTASVDPETYELYLKGRYFFEKLSIPKSIEYFQAAIERRPDYALAFASMAEAYTMTVGLPPQEARAKANAAARAALRIDDTLAEAHDALAQALYRHDWDWTGAKREFERALALNPNYALAHNNYGQYQHTLGWKTWVAEVKRAHELDPLNTWFGAGAWYLESGEYDAAIALLQKRIELDPDKQFTYSQLGGAYLKKGAYQDAIRSLRRAVALSEGRAPAALGLLGYAYAMSGERAEAMKILAQLEQLSRQQYVPPYEFAVIYAGLGEKDLAFSRLTEAVANHDRALVGLKWSVELDGLRGDPRFAELKRAIGLP